MVKFGKELESELVPEWKEKYIDYKLLKKPIQKIKLLRQSPNFDDTELSFFDLVARKLSVWFRSSGNTTDQVESVSLEGHDSEDKEEAEEESEEEDEVNKFRDLFEKEVVKVNEFHRNKESEMVERGYALNRQLLTLLHFHRRPDSLTTTFPSTGNPNVASGFSESDVARQDSEIAWQMSSEKGAIELENMVGRTNTSVSIDVLGGGGGATSAYTATDNVNFLKMKKRHESGDYFQKKIQTAEKMIRDAYIEFYNALNRLNSYSSLNMLGFMKIMKKFDKVTDRQESDTYLREVKGKHFMTSNKVSRLTTEVECLFTKHFAGNDRKKAMKQLKFKQRQHSNHMTCFLVGVCTGCCVTLSFAYALLAHIYGMFSPSTNTGYMETIYPVFSIFALVSLHMFMYGCNLLFWKTKNINYILIFNLQSKTALKHIEAFLISTSLMVIVVLAMIIHLRLLSAGVSPNKVDCIPGFILLSLISLLICPLDVFYRPTRYCFLRVMRNIVLSPFCKVLMVDFFMADQLTSQIPLLRHIETTTCYYIASSFRTHNFETCRSGKKYRLFAYAISFSPYYARAMQCVRRWYDESNTTHLANMGKYLSAMVAAGARLRYMQQQDSLLWMIIVIVTSVIATTYQLYWDFVKDWGLLNLNSKNPWLRDNLILKNKSIYYISIALNVVLRIVWIECVLKLKASTLQNSLIDFLMASAEVIRRGHWNFYRMEYEQLNNAEKLRAEKNAPLPFENTKLGE